MRENHAICVRVGNPGLYRYTLAMRYLVSGEIFENILELKHFGLYFEDLRIENGCFHIEIMISATEMLGGLGACSPRKF